ncbi:hypothetical protein JOF53_006766 [Crossiella equi]|uniref:Uncharacterized protein n=1 Tax=Crossiella equi TaxID=130796 RepID=A0ABS5ANX5_9PSEU|nr:hypothetical protein [Crossiella equi]
MRHAVSVPPIAATRPALRVARVPPAAAMSP